MNKALKILFTIIVLLNICVFGYCDEVIVDFEEQSVPVLNEELRKLRSTLTTVEGRNVRSPIWFVGGDLETSTATSAKITLPFDGTITKAIAIVKTAPRSSSHNRTCMENRY